MTDRRHHTYVLAVCVAGLIGSLYTCGSSWLRSGLLQVHLRARKERKAINETNAQVGLPISGPGAQPSWRAKAGFPRPREPMPPAPPPPVPMSPAPPLAVTPVAQALLPLVACLIVLITYVYDLVCSFMLNA